MAPRSIISLGSLFAASFLATWLVMDPGSTPLARAARTAFTGNDSWNPAPGTVVAETTKGEQALDAADAGIAEVPDAPPDFIAAARDATAAPSTDERVRALQMLGEAPAVEGIDTLIAVSAQSADAGERATAITALRQRRGASGADERIRDAFRLAAQDPDPLVAVLAQSAMADAQL